MLPACTGTADDHIPCIRVGCVGSRLRLTGLLGPVPVAFVDKQGRRCRDRYVYMQHSSPEYIAALVDTEKTVCCMSVAAVCTS